MSNKCPNKSLPEFQEMSNILGDKIATSVWVSNNGYPLTKAPNGSDSKLYNDLLEQHNGDVSKTTITKAKTHSISFKKWFGEWANMQEGGINLEDVLSAEDLARLGNLDKELEDLEASNEANEKKLPLFKSILDFLYKMVKLITNSVKKDIKKVTDAQGVVSKIYITLSIVEHHKLRHFLPKGDANKISGLAGVLRAAMDTVTYYTLSEEAYASSEKDLASEDFFKVEESPLSEEKGNKTTLNLKYTEELSSEVPQRNRSAKLRREFERLKSLRDQSIEDIKNLEAVLNADGNLDVVGSSKVIKIVEMGLTTLEEYKTQAVDKILKEETNFKLKELAQKSMPRYESTEDTAQVEVTNEGHLSSKLGRDAIELPPQAEKPGLSEHAYRVVNSHLNDKGMTLKSELLGHSKAAHVVWESLVASGDAFIVKGNSSDFKNGSYSAVYSFRAKEAPDSMTEKVDENGEPLVTNITSYQKVISKANSNNQGIQDLAKASEYHADSANKGINSPNKKRVDKELSKNQISKVNKELDRKLKGFLDLTGMTTNFTDDILVDGKKVDAVAMTDMVSKVIDVIQDKMDITTLPEESGHVFFEMLPEGNSLRERMLDKIEDTEIYKQVVAEYSELYNGDSLKLKKEAIGKLIGNEIIKLENNERPSMINFIGKWFDRAVKFLKGLVTEVSSDEINPFIASAKAILSNDVSELNSEKIWTKEDYYFQVTPSEIANAAKIVERLRQLKIVPDRVNGGYKTIAGKKVHFRPSDYVAEFMKRIFPYSNNKFTEIAPEALKGTYLHKLAEIIIQSLDSGISKDVLKSSSEIKSMLALVKAELIKESDDFKKLEDSFFTMLDYQVSEIINGVSHVFNEIKKNEAFINGNSEAKGKAVLLPELLIYDETTGKGGTIDLAVVYPNGAIGIYDWKSMRFKRDALKVVEGIPWYKKEAFGVQISHYKDMLKNAYGVKKFAETRIIPIDVQLRKAKMDGFYSISMPINQPDSVNYEFLKSLPVADEMTDIKSVDKVLKKLIIKRDNLVKLLTRDTKNNTTKTALEKITDMIEQIQSYKNLDYFVKNLTSIHRTFMDRVQITDPDAKGFITSKDLDLLSEYLDAFDQAKQELIEASAFAGDPATKLLYSQVSGRIDELQKMIKTKSLDYVIEDELIGPDILNPHKELTYMGRLFEGIGDIDSPVFRSLANIISSNQDKTRRRVNALIETISSKQEVLKKWAKDSNLSELDAYSKIYDEDTGTLISKFSKEHLSNLKKAQEESDRGWMIKHARFDNTEYEKFKAKIFKRIETDNVGVSDEYIARQKNALINKYDIRVNGAAMFNKGNFFVSLKDNPKKYNDKYQYMLKNEPLKDYYDTYIEFNKEFNDLVGGEVSSRFIAEIRQNTLDKIVQQGKFGLGTMKGNFLHSLESWDYDMASRPLDNNNNPIKSIPLFMMQALRETLSLDRVKSISKEIELEGDLTKGSLNFKNELSRRVVSEEFKKGRESKSIDLTKSLILFAENVYTNEMLNETETLVNSLRRVITSDQITTKLTDTRGNSLIDRVKIKTIVRDGISESDLESLDKFVDMYWYGMHTQNKDFTWKGKDTLDEEGNVISDGKVYSSTNMIKMIMNYTSLKALALDPILGAGNAIGIYTNTVMLAAGGRYFNRHHLNKSQKLSAQRDKKFLSAEAFFEVSARNLTLEKANNRSASKLTRLVTHDNLYITLKKPDDVIDGHLLGAMLLNYGKDKDGKIKSLSKLPEGSKSLWEHSNFSEKKGFNLDLSEQEFIRFRKMVQSVGTAVKGSIPEDNKKLITSTIYGQALMQFRGWMPGLVKNRVGVTRYDPLFDEVITGRFIVVANEIVNSGGFMNSLGNVTRILAEAALMSPISRFTNKSFFKKDTSLEVSKMYYGKFVSKNPELSNKVRLEDYQAMRISRLREFSKELSLYMTFIVVAALLKAAIPDEDKDQANAWGRFIAKTSYKTFNRGLLELSFFFDPESLMGLLENPIASARGLTDVAKLIDNTWDVAEDLLWEEDARRIAVFKKGAWDKTPLGYRTIGMAPLINQVVDFVDVFEKPIH